MSEWFKVWWHCLINFHCKVTTEESIGMFSNRTRHWCECGFNNNGVTWQQHLKSVGLK